VQCAMEAKKTTGALGWISSAAAVSLVIVTWGLAEKFRPFGISDSELAGPMVIALIALPIATGSFLHGFALRRNTKRLSADKLHRMLARTFRPLKTTDEELRTLVEWCRVALPQMHTLLDATRLHAALRAQRDISLTNVDQLALTYPFLATTREDIERRQAQANLDSE
jgi:hypothetical protein